MSADLAKINAARVALDLVEDGMTLGLGTGSTAAHFVRLLGERVRAGLEVRGVPTSEATRRLAQEAGIALIGPDDAERIDLAIDGADEVDPQRVLIKGGGGALLREKIIAAAAARFIVIVDATKCVPALGAFALPVEVTPFAAALTARRIQAAMHAGGCSGDAVTMRLTPAGAPFVTDGGNHIHDCACRVIPDPAALAHALDSLPGVVEHGLFVAMVHGVIVGDVHGARMLD